MNLITTDTLHELGIHKSADDGKALIEHFQATLNERVGLTIMDVLNDEQATRLIELTEAGNQMETTAYLNSEIPEYSQIIQNEYDILMGEMAENADKL